MSTPESSSQPSARKRGKRPRKASSDLSIVEIFPDDMGYDADVEVLQPDQYEEVASDDDGVLTPIRKHRTVDEELAARMQSLANEDRPKQPPQTPSCGRGRKRHTQEANDTNSSRERRRRQSDLEVSEIHDPGARSPPSKRRRKRSRQPTALLQLKDAPGTPLRSSPLMTDGTDSSQGAQDAMDLT